MANFTKGPWIRAGMLGHGILISSEHKHIAVLYSSSVNEDGPFNAYLVSAAPDLYAALKEKERLFIEMAQVIYKDEIANHLPHGLRERVQESLRMGKADAAIARAEGRQA